MKAPYTTTATFIWGPAFITGGIPRIISAPCRPVPDPFFKDDAPPLSDSTLYLTSDAGLPRESQNTLLSAGRWEFNFNFADRVVIADRSAFTYYVQRVELCTWPTFPSLYYRSSLALAGPAPTACQLKYFPTYTMSGAFGPIPGPVVRVGPKTWYHADLFMLAEFAAIDPDTCVSTWFISYAGHTWTGPYNGVGLGVFERDDGPGNDIFIFGG